MTILVFLNDTKYRVFCNKASGLSSFVYELFSLYQRSVSVLNVFWGKQLDVWKTFCHSSVRFVLLFQLFDYQNLYIMYLIVVAGLELLRLHFGKQDFQTDFRFFRFLIVTFVFFQLVFELAQSYGTKTYLIWED